MSGGRNTNRLIQFQFQPLIRDDYSFFFKFSFFSQIHFCCSSAETLKYKEFIINQK